MSRHLAGLVCVALCVGPGFAPAGAADEGYRVEGTVHDRFPSIAGRVAILPPSAPAELEAAWLQRKLAGQKDTRPKAPLVSLRDTQAAVAKLAVDPSRPASRGPLAAELGVDSFLEIEISDLATWKSAEARAPEGGSVIGKERTDRARAKVRLRIVSADSGTTWFEGTTEGSQLAKGIQPLVADMLDRLFERAYPARRYR